MANKESENVDSLLGTGPHSVRGGAPPNNAELSAENVKFADGGPIHSIAIKPSRTVSKVTVRHDESGAIHLTLE